MDARDVYSCCKKMWDTYSSSLKMLNEKRFSDSLAIADEFEDAEDEYYRLSQQNGKIDEPVDEIAKANGASHVIDKMGESVISIKRHAEQERVPEWDLGIDADSEVYFLRVLDRLASVSSGGAVQGKIDKRSSFQASLPQPIRELAKLNHIKGPLRKAVHIAADHFDALNCATREQAHEFIRGMLPSGKGLWGETASDFEDAISGAMLSTESEPERESILEFLKTWRLFVEDVWNLKDSIRKTPLFATFVGRDIYRQVSGFLLTDEIYNKQPHRTLAK